MLKIVRTLPKILKYLPNEKAQDARNFMLSFRPSSLLLAGPAIWGGANSGRSPVILL